MNTFVCCILAMALLSGCGINEYMRIDDRYFQPGALDAPLTGYYDSYSYRFLDKYRIAHKWPVISNCKYGKLPTLRGKHDRYRGEAWAVDDITEDVGKTWQVSAPDEPVDFDRYVRSVKKLRPTYRNVNGQSQRIGEEEKEEGFKAMCGETWQTTNHSFTFYLHKRDLADWRALWTEWSPQGKWSDRRVGANLWQVQETAEQDFKSKPRGYEGPFQTWLLPIGDTGYILALELSANQKSLQYPEAHARFQTAFRHLIESVRIDPLTPEVEAEMKQLHAQAEEVQRLECIEMAKRRKPFEWCLKYLDKGRPGTQ